MRGLVLRNDGAVGRAARGVLEIRGGALRRLRAPLAVGACAHRARLAVGGFQFHMDAARAMVEEHFPRSFLALRVGLGRSAVRSDRRRIDTDTARSCSRCCCKVSTRVRSATRTGRAYNTVRVAHRPAPRGVQDVVDPRAGGRLPPAPGWVPAGARAAGAQTRGRSELRLTVWRSEPDSGRRARRLRYARRVPRTPGVHAAGHAEGPPAPRRIVSLVPSLTEDLFAIGAGRGRRRLGIYRLSAAGETLQSSRRSRRSPSASSNCTPTSRRHQRPRPTRGRPAPRRHPDRC